MKIKSNSIYLIDLGEYILKCKCKRKQNSCIEFWEKQIKSIFENNWIIALYYKWWVICLRSCGQISVCVLFHKLISNSLSVGNKTASCNGGVFDVLVMVTSGRNAQQWYAYESTNVCFINLSFNGVEKKKKKTTYNKNEQLK